MRLAFDWTFNEVGHCPASLTQAPVAGSDQESSS